jgi:hypothetical protein
MSKSYTKEWSPRELDRETCEDDFQMYRPSPSIAKKYRRARLALHKDRMAKRAACRVFSDHEDVCPGGEEPEDDDSTEEGDTEDQVDVDCDSDSGDPSLAGDSESEEEFEGGCHEDPDPESDFEQRFSLELGHNLNGHEESDDGRSMVDPAETAAGVDTGEPLYICLGCSE